jgi:hypothetical protein
MLLSSLGKHALALRNGCSLAARKFSLSCSLNNEPTTQEWVCPLSLIDLMREGEGFSNLTVEIRLDEWMRLDVSSLTLTLVIKSPFNLHLTNEMTRTHIRHFLPLRRIGKRNTCLGTLFNYKFNNTIVKKIFIH